jgi:hypothetical protein
MSMTRTIVYVACADSHEIAVLRLDPASGALAPVQQVATGGTVMPLAVSRDRRRLYASIRSAPLAVLSFAIDADDGTLAPLGTSPLPASMCWIGLDRSGRWLLSASYGESLVAVSPIGADGVAGAARQTVGTAPNAHSIQTDPANRFAFAACLGGDVVSAFAFDAAGGALELRPEPAWRTRAGAGRATSPSIRRRPSSTCSTSSTPRSMRSSTMPRPAASATSRRSARCRRASSASPGRPTSTSAPTAASSTPASAARAPSPRSRSTPRAAG